MHPGEQEVVAASNGNARRRPPRGGNIGPAPARVIGRHAAPAQPHRGLGIEIEAPHPARPFHDGAQLGDRDRPGSRTANRRCRPRASRDWPSRWKPAARRRAAAARCVEDRHARESSPPDDAARAAMNSGIAAAGCWPSASIVSTWVNPSACGRPQPVQHRRALAAIVRRGSGRASRDRSPPCAVSASPVPSVLPSTTTQTGSQKRRASRTVSRAWRPVL